MLSTKCLYVNRALGTLVTLVLLLTLAACDSGDGGGAEEQEETPDPIVPSCAASLDGDAFEAEVVSANFFNSGTPTLQVLCQGDDADGRVVLNLLVEVSVGSEEGNYILGGSDQQGTAGAVFGTSPDLRGGQTFEFDPPREAGRVVIEEYSDTHVVGTFEYVVPDTQAGGSDIQVTTGSFESLVTAR